MKKVLGVICISALLAACNGDSSKTTDVTKDSSTSVSTDTTSKMASPATTDTTTHVMKDSTVKTVDTTKKAK
jgi:hypothetical protein